MNLERILKKKRAFIGYNIKEVKKNIQSLQEQYQKEQERLQQEISAEKEKNQTLKAQLDEIKTQPIKNPLAEDLTLILKNHFFEQSRSLLELKIELQDKENKLKEKLAEKVQKKELAQKKIEEVLLYLKNQNIELKKELDE